MSECLAATALPAVVSCQAAIDVSERGGRLPAGLMQAISLVESGRFDRSAGRLVSWPWTIDVAGKGQMFDSKDEAIAAVLAAQATGVTSIDVGCMQINLLHHPDAFRNLDEAFDPGSNTRYAATFLNQLYARLGDWRSAIASYHSATPGVADAYRVRVLAAWGVAPPPGRCVAGVRRRTDSNGAGSSGPRPEGAGLLWARLAEARADQVGWMRQGWLPASTASVSVDETCTPHARAR